MTAFEDAWAAFPHYKQRSKKAICRGMFKQITTTGRDTTVDGIRLNVVATENDIKLACKAYAMSIIRDDTPDADNYVPGFQVWLNQGRFEDFEESERNSLAAEYDRLQERIAERRLRIVK